MVKTLLLLCTFYHSSKNCSTPFQGAERRSPGTTGKRLLFRTLFYLERVDTLEEDTAQLLVQVLVKSPVVDGLTLYHGSIHLKQRFNRRLIPAFCQP